ncbi:hypothetical protein L1887_62950 [Cichorium endivia]|nr:hypothetical protein L1887_62950 [Cichorium endivia]
MLEAIFFFLRQDSSGGVESCHNLGGDGFKENVETPSVWSARPAELAAEEIRRTNAAGGVQNRPAEDGRAHVVEPRAREALKKGGGDGRLYSESMSELDSAKMIIDAGSSDNIASTEMVDQLGPGKLKQDVWCEVVPMYYISYSEDRGNTSRVLPA